MATRYRRVSRLLLAGLSLAVSVSLVGCKIIDIFGLPADFAYTFAFENYTDHPLKVSFGGSEDSVRPCSVYQSTFTGPHYGTPVVLEVHDDKGASVLSLDVIAASGQADRPFYLQIGGPDASGCPAPQEGYVLVVENRLKDAIEIRREGAEVGSIPARSQARFGPFPGHWKDMAGWSVRRADGDEHPIRPTRLHVDYDLGKVPEAKYIVA